MSNSVLTFSALVVSSLATLASEVGTEAALAIVECEATMGPVTVMTADSSDVRKAAASQPYETADGWMTDAGYVASVVGSDPSVYLVRRDFPIFGGDI